MSEETTLSNTESVDNLDKTLIQPEETYEGDLGDMPLEVRRVLLTLMRGPYLWKKERKKQWDLMMRSQMLLRKTLANCFLDLVIDEDTGVAFVEQAKTDSYTAPSLLTSYRLRFIDSVVILKMREMLVQTAPLNERATISRDEITETVRTFDPSTRNNEQVLVKRVTALINRLCERHLLISLVEDNTFEISPVLRLVFDANEVNALLEAYKNQLSQREKSAQILADDEEVQEEE